MNRVVITGIGAWSCLGKNVDEVKNSLFTGKSGIGFDQVRKDMGYRSALTGIVDAPVLKGLLDRRARISMGQPAEYAYMATSEALRMANMDPDWIASQEVGIIYGNDSVAKSTMEAIDIVRAKKDTTLVGSGATFQSMNSTVTAPVIPTSGSSHISKKIFPVRTAYSTCSIVISLGSMSIAFCSNGAATGHTCGSSFGRI